MKLSKSQQEALIKDFKFKYDEFSESIYCEQNSFPLVIWKRQILTHKLIEDFELRPLTEIPHNYKDYSEVEFGVYYQAKDGYTVAFEVKHRFLENILDESTGLQVKIDGDIINLENLQVNIGKYDAYSYFDLGLNKILGLLLDDKDLEFSIKYSLSKRLSFILSPQTKNYYILKKLLLILANEDGQTDKLIEEVNNKIKILEAQRIEHNNTIIEKYRALVKKREGGLNAWIKKIKDIFSIS